MARGVRDGLSTPRPAKRLRAHAPVAPQISQSVDHTPDVRCNVKRQPPLPQFEKRSVGAAAGKKMPLDERVSYSLPLVMTYTMALAVLADPTRRKVFERLRAGPRPVNALAAGLPVSRPAVSQHLKALKDAGLVEERSEGVRRIYSLRREGLTELRDWLDTFWDDALAAFKEEVEKPE